MPIYEFKHSNCNSTDEYFLKVDELPKNCKSCGDTGEFVRLISPCGLRFKGAGFYINDSKRGGDKRESLSDINRAKIYTDE